MNIKFSYLYRDASNYKNGGEVIFSNPSNIRIEKVEAIVREHLIDGEWFYSTEWCVPDLHFDTWEPDDDHFLHEFVKLEEVTDESNTDISIESFLKRITAARNSYIT